MQLIRSFIAVPLEKPVERSAVKLLKSLQQEQDGIRWVPAENLHLTLKFLGDVDNRQVPVVCEAIRSVVSQVDAFPLSFRGTMALPSDLKARVLCAGVDDPTQTLVQMVASLEKAMAELGFKPEARDYVPHLTLGRVRKTSRRANDDVLRRLRAQQDVHLGTMTADRALLMASFLDRGGPTYQVMATIPFGQ
ncbi:RNA 2',3'-cyclic phosphodiesterase [Crateriforma conspicua]|uniref:RNA 2',3'-cyclic phosphodiesterase n=1 Tax=Crateriforma conspicua TaxID=2527996 RepID=A0A5C5Y4R2_9PLAN|nr:RNA 2',3'-cyclic phosphodiesterase [Crateriforma conspicua]TWT70250.1 2',5' RNA ligase family [Crateriforma conspicua]